MVYAIYPDFNGNPLGRVEHILYWSFCRLVWGICLSYMCFACALKNVGLHQIHHFTFLISRNLMTNNFSLFTCSRIHQPHTELAILETVLSTHLRRLPDPFDSDQLLRGQLGQAFALERRANGNQTLLTTADNSLIWPLIPSCIYSRLGNSLDIWSFRMQVLT